MEAVKATIPRTLLQHIDASQIGDVEVTCSALASHFKSSATCSQLLEQLAEPNKTTCAKDSEKALQYKREGNAAFGTSSFEQARDSYTKALRYSPLATQVDATTIATLFVNRAAALHALEQHVAATRDCSRAIKLQPEYSKAWYRRGRAWAGLHWYKNAIEDLEKALFLESSASGKNQVSHELDKVKVIVKFNKHFIPSENCNAGPTKWKSGEGFHHDGVSSYWTSEKQRGMHATKDLEAGSLVLEEEPMAALILKGHRNTHCHFCFEMLPPDPVVCFTCAIPLYCDVPCMGAACDESSEELDGQKWKGEHMHECGGASWSAVLPTDAVLGARLFARGQGNAHLGEELDDLCHHYNKMSYAAKVDLHVMATVTAHCLFRNPANNWLGQTLGDVAAKLVRSVAVVRANAMGICAVQFSADEKSKSTSSLKNNIDKSVVSQVEQVNVAQGVYILGSKFNHSCSTNVHASFKYRQLRVRTIVPIGAGSPLELCYGAQVGEMRRNERQEWLHARYFFTCACLSCKTVSQPDLLLFAFRCSKAACDGVVPGPSLLKQLDQRVLRNDSTEANALKPGWCISCGTAINLQYFTDAAHAVIEEFARFFLTKLFYYNCLISVA